MRSQREASSFGLRWQSEAPTPLWLDGIRDFALESRHKANPAKAVSPLRSAPAVQMKTLIEAGLRNTRENPMMHENMEGPLMSRRMALFSLLTGIAFFGWTETPFDYFDNSWSVIGLKDYARGTRITPDNALMIGTTIGTA